MSERLTRLEAVTLGLLIDRPAHAYALRARLAPGLPREARPNDGVVRPLLARLTRRGLVDHACELVDGRSRKVFSATPAGRRAFQAWLVSDADEGHGLDSSLFLDHPFLKLLFAGHLTPAQRHAKLDRVQAAARARRAALEQMRDSGAASGVGALLLELGLAHEEAVLAAGERLRTAI